MLLEYILWLRSFLFLPSKCSTYVGLLRVPCVVVYKIVSLWVGVNLKLDDQDEGVVVVRPRRDALRGRGPLRRLPRLCQPRPHHHQRGPQDRPLHAACQGMHIPQILQISDISKKWKKEQASCCCTACIACKSLWISCKTTKKSPNLFFFPLHVHVFISLIRPPLAVTNSGSLFDI